MDDIIQAQKLKTNSEKRRGTFMKLKSIFNNQQITLQRKVVLFITNVSIQLQTRTLKWRYRMITLRTKLHMVKC